MRDRDWLDRFWSPAWLFCSGDDDDGGGDDGGGDGGDDDGGGPADDGTSGSQSDDGSTDDSAPADTGSKDSSSSDTGGASSTDSGASSSDPGSDTQGPAAGQGAADNVGGVPDRSLGGDTQSPSADGAGPGIDTQSPSADTAPADTVGGVPDSALGAGPASTGGTQGVSTDVGTALDAAGQAPAAAALDAPAPEPAPSPTNTNPNAINAPDMTIDPTIPAPSPSPQQFLDPAFAPPGQQPNIDVNPAFPMTPGPLGQASPSNAAIAAGLPGGVTSISDLLAGQTPVAAALNAAQSPTDQVIANAQRGVAGQPGQTQGTQLAANAFGPGTDIVGIGVSQPGMGNLPGGATGPATSPALDTFGGQLGTIPGAFNQAGLDAIRTLEPTGDIQAPSLSTQPADQPGGVPGGRLGMGPDATGGIQDPSIVGGGPPDAAAPQGQQTVNRDLKGDMSQFSTFGDLTGDQFPVAGGPPSAPTATPNQVAALADPANSSMFTEPPTTTPSVTVPLGSPNEGLTVFNQPGPNVSSPVDTVPLPTARPDTAPQPPSDTTPPPAQVAGPGAPPAPDVSPITTPIGPDATSSLNDAFPGSDIFSGSTLNDAGGGGGNAGGGTSDNNLANLITQPIPADGTSPPPAADGGPSGTPPTPFNFQFPGYGDQGAPAGNFNPEEGLFAPQGQPGGAANFTLPGGVQGPIPPVAGGGQQVGGTIGGANIPGAMLSPDAQNALQ